MRPFSRLVIAAAHRLGHGYAFTLLGRMREARAYLRGRRTGSFSQHGEDRFLLDYFGRGYQGFYIDIGASHPVIISNTYLLWRDGWRGITAEPIPFLHERHKQLRKGDTSLNVGVSDVPGAMAFWQMVPGVLSTFDEDRMKALVRQGWRVREERIVPVLTLAELHSRYGTGREIDLLTVDVEGWDLRVLMGNDWRSTRPRVVVCEVSDENEAAIIAFLESRAYRLLARLGCNVVFEREKIEGAWTA